MYKVLLFKFMGHLCKGLRRMSPQPCHAVFDKASRLWIQGVLFFRRTLKALVIYIFYRIEFAF